jgi:hypothetical protein
MGEAALPELVADGTTEGELAGLLRENPRSAYALAKGALSQAASRLEPIPGTDRQPESRLLLIVDQFEELFTDERNTPAERAGFVDALAALARGGRAWMIATLRSDFYPLCARLPELVELKRGDGQYDLARPTPAEIGQIVRRPAAAAGLRFEASGPGDARSPLDPLAACGRVAGPRPRAAAVPIAGIGGGEPVGPRGAPVRLAASGGEATGGRHGALGVLERRAEFDRARVHRAIASSGAADPPVEAGRHGGPLVADPSGGRIGGGCDS